MHQLNFFSLIKFSFLFTETCLFSTHTRDVKVDKSEFGTEMAAVRKHLILNRVLWFIYFMQGATDQAFCLGLCIMSWSVSDAFKLRNQLHRSWSLPVTLLLSISPNSIVGNSSSRYLLPSLQSWTPPKPVPLSIPLYLSHYCLSHLDSNRTI